MGSFEGEIRGHFRHRPQSCAWNVHGATGMLEPVSDGGIHDRHLRSVAVDKTNASANGAASNA
jgi:hypothetical protein